MDGPPDIEAQGKPPGHITILEASTGRNLAGYDFHGHTPLHDLEIMWSMSGEVCLLDPLNWVLVCCPQADPTFTSFQVYELSGSTFDPTVSLQTPSLSPCGSTVIDLNKHWVNHDTGLQHWQIPPTAVALKKSASALEILQPIICADFMASQQNNGVLTEA